MWELARSVGLDENSPYAYVMWGDYFADTSVVVTDGDGADAALSGFVMGFHPPQHPDTLFVWQVGVAEHARGQGMASRMIDHLIERLGVDHVEATVTPDNNASAALFRGLTKRHGGTANEVMGYPQEMFPGGHEAEVRFTIGPFDTVATTKDDPQTGSSSRQTPRGDS